MGIIVRQLTAQEVQQAQTQAAAVANSASSVVTQGQFVFFAAFDGTNNDRNNLSTSNTTQTTNVAQLEDQVAKQNIGNPNVQTQYYPGPGTEGSLPGSSFNPYQVTQQAVNTAQKAYDDFSFQAARWLDTHPGGSVTTMVTGFSRGDAPAAIFSQMLYERGLVDPRSGNMLLPPGVVGVSAGVIFDPVVTGVLVNVAFAPNAKNIVAVRSMDEFRVVFKAADYSTNPGVTTLDFLGNHGDNGGFYDQGLGALSLGGATGFFRNSGLSIADVPANRQFNATAPVVLHSEGVDSYGNRIWDEYGVRGGRLTDAQAVRSGSHQIFDDGSSLSSIVNYAGKTVIATIGSDGVPNNVNIFNENRQLEVSVSGGGSSYSVTTVGNDGVQTVKQYNLGSVISTNVPVTTNGTENNTVITLTHTGDPVVGQTGPGNTGTIAGGTSWVTNMDPGQVNTGTTFYDGTTGDTASDGVRPGNVQVGVVGTTIGAIDTAAGNLGAGQGGTHVAGDLNSIGAILVNAGANTHGVAVDPLILDLNGDGIKLVSLASSQALFDVDNDGVAANGQASREHTGWVATATTSGHAFNTDGIVVHDLDGNGVIDGIRETLSEHYKGTPGNQPAPVGHFLNAPDGLEDRLLALYNQALNSTDTPGTPTFSSGFAALGSLNSNGDSVFDSQDAAWGSLRVWVDDNGDGLSFKDVNGNGVRDGGETTELKTFTELGITAINLYNSQESGLVSGGNTVVASGSFTVNGQSASAAAVQFMADSRGHAFASAAGGAGTVISTQGDAVGTTVRSYVSANGNSTVNETLGVTALDVSNVYAGAGGDVLIGDSAANWLSGGAGADTFDAGAGDDVLLVDADDSQAGIHAGAGNDVVQVIGTRGVTFNMTQAEAEVFVGGSGSDVVIGGGRSSVVVRGGAGNDVIIGGAANDVLSGEDGLDLIDGGAGNDLIRGHEGTDNLFGGQGDDVVDGGAGDDSLSGGAGADVLIGGSGNDVIDGGDGLDVVEYAGSYADYEVTRLNAGTWRVTDIRTGSAGSDTLTNVEKLSFKDLTRTYLDWPNPLPVDDTLRTNAAGQLLSRTTPQIIAANQLLANDRDWQADALRIAEVFDARGGVVALNSAGDVVFTPDPSFTGVMGFHYRTSDSAGNASSFVINETTGESAQLKGTVFLATPDVPGDPLTVKQWYLGEINAYPVWKDYTGRGVRVAIAEPGGPFSLGPEVFDYRHPDLKANASMLWMNRSAIPQDFSNHATMVAGVVAAARNGEGGVGVAYNAQLAGEFVAGGREFPFPTFSTYDVVNNSWGLVGASVASSSGLWVNDFYRPVAEGRGGLGTALVFAAGNQRAQGSNTNLSIFTSDRAVITVGAINQPGDLGALVAGAPPFSTAGANILVSAPGSNISSTSRALLTENGSTFSSDTGTNYGTSLATPIVSGVVALMLEANTKLGYRDIQTILALSATKFDDPNGTDWAYNGAQGWNGGGMHVSHDYGFGKVDALAAVRLAESWQLQSTRTNEQTLHGASGDINLSVPDGGPAAGSTIAIGAGLKLENAKVTLQMDHQRWGDLTVKLIAPSGTESVLLNRTGKVPAGFAGNSATDYGDTYSGTLTLDLDSTHLRGESSAGNWTLQVVDAASGSTGTLMNWMLDLYGSTATTDDLYVYTNEFKNAAGSQRDTLTDGNAGTDTINASAVSTNSVINLLLGSSSQIAGRALTIASDIENVFSGDGNDVLTGNALANTLVGGRGNDAIDGGAGADVLDGGQGQDRLTGGAGSDRFIVRKEAGSIKTITDFSVAGITDKLALIGFDNQVSFGSSFAAAEGADARINLPDGQSILLLNVQPNQLVSALVEFQPTPNPTWSPFDQPVGQVTGTSADDVLTGDGGANRIDGLAGADSMTGRTGDDTYVVDSPGDAVIEQADAGFDAVEAGIGYTLPANVEMVTLTGTAGINVMGNEFDNRLYGNAADNRLDGGAGADLMQGGEGDDTYVVDDAADRLVEHAGEGNDTVISSLTYTLGADLENLTLIGINPINGTGNAMDNRLAGNSGANVLRGGAGNDTYVVDGAHDTIVEMPHEGSDTVVASADWTLGANLENLTLSGAQWLSGTGNELGNTIVGNDGANNLNGLAGSDLLRGGKGDDSYLFNVGHGFDVIDEDALAGGIDTVVFGEGIGAADVVAARVGQDLTLSHGAGDKVTVRNWFSADVSKVERVAFADGTLWNVADIRAKSGTALTAGTPLANQLVAEDAIFAYTIPSDSLQEFGVTLSYRASMTNGDFLPGWLTFDRVTRSFSGTPRNSDVGSTLVKVTATDPDGVAVSSTFNLTVANVNDAPRLSSWYTSISATQYEPKTFKPALFEDDDLGDTLTYSAGLTDGQALPAWLVVDPATGSFSGNPASSGVMSIRVTATDSAGASASSTFSLSVASPDGVILGTSGNDSLTGTAAGDTLVGFDGDDLLAGQEGADRLIGGAGQDTYRVDNVDDVVIELVDEGTDKIQAGVSFTLPANVEQLELLGTSVAIEGSGNELNNKLVGNAWANVLNGYAGNDSINGGAGNDQMIGGTGNDLYHVDSAGDTIVELTDEGTDTVNTSVSYVLPANVENLTITSGAVNATGNALNNLIQGSSSNNTINGGAGDDYIIGGGGADTMTGGDGNDTFSVDNVGDTVTEAANGGYDRVRANLNYIAPANVEAVTLINNTGVANTNATGNALDNELVGTSGNNVLDGLEGVDSMIGGAGNDTYRIDNIGDVVVELANEGTDIVSSSIAYTLPDAVENLTLVGVNAVNGTGNDAANSVTGNAADNILSGLGGNDVIDAGAGNDTLFGGLGDDRLIGGTGADQMLGGDGNDTYTVDSVSDVVTELANEGVDTVDYRLNTNYTLGANVENLTLNSNGAALPTVFGNELDNTISSDPNGRSVVLQGMAGNDRLTGGYYKDTLSGGEGNDFLSGGVDADQMSGGAGDDVYVVSQFNVSNPSLSDTVVEAANEGYDTVQSLPSYTLPANVEALILTGTGNTNATGNQLDNEITGNSGINVIDGGTGSDRMTGGLGSDTYLFGRGYGSDTVVEDDATAGNLDAAVFGANITADQLWFRKVNDSLEVSVIGTTDSLTVANWYLGNQYHLEMFKTNAGKTLLDTQVQNLVQAMAGFAPPSMGQTTLPQNYHSSLDSVIAANWQ